MDSHRIAWPRLLHVVEAILTPICAAFIGACAGLVIAVFDVLHEPKNPGYPWWQYPTTIAVIGGIWGTYCAIQNWREQSQFELINMDGHDAQG